MRQAHQLTGNWTVSFQHTTRTTMTNLSLKQENIIRAHSIPIAPKHDHSNTTNYVWDRSFTFKRSSIQDRRLLTFLQNPHFSQRRVETKSHQASQPSTIGCVKQGLSNPLSSSSNIKAQDPQDCSQLTSCIVHDPLRCQVHVKISTASFVVTYFCHDLNAHCST
jgi:hypothetical protein